MIILMNVPNKYPFVNPKHPPLGLGYICSYLKSKNIDAEIYDLGAYPLSINKAIDLMLGSKPEIVGLTCYEQNYFLIRRFCELLKKKDISIKTVIGGPAATFAYKKILVDTPYIDFCVQGEGEYTLLELYNNLNGTSDDFYNIKGISFKNKNEIITTENRSFIKNLDSIPSPYLERIFDMKYYDMANLISGRGCPMKCIYCTCGAMFGGVRFHSPKRILEEIDYLYELNNKIHWQKGPFLFTFIDDTLTISKKQINSILDGLEKRNYNISWAGETRIMQITKEILVRMKNNGLKSVTFGLESADPYVLKILKKVSSKGDDLTVEKKFLEKFKEVIKWTKELKIQTFVSFILGSPFETYENAKKTIEFCSKNQKEFGIIPIPNILVPFHGTEVFKRYKEFDMSVKEHPDFLLPYYINKYSKIDIKHIIELIPKDSQFFVFDEIFSRSLHVFKKLKKKEFFKSSEEFRKFLLKKQFISPEIPSGVY